MRVTVNGSRTHGSAGGRHNGELSSGFSSKGGPKNDDNTYGTTLNLEFPPNATNLQYLAYEVALRDQGWGGSGSVSFWVNVYLKNYAQMGYLETANRDNHNYPNYGKSFDAEKVRSWEVDHREVSCKDIFSNLS